MKEEIFMNRKIITILAIVVLAVLVSSLVLVLTIGRSVHAKADDFEAYVKNTYKAVVYEMNSNTSSEYYYGLHGLYQFQNHTERDLVSGHLTNYTFYLVNEEKFLSVWINIADKCQIDRMDDTFYFCPTHATYYVYTP